MEGSSERTVDSVADDLSGRFGNSVFPENWNAPCTFDRYIASLENVWADRRRGESLRATGNPVKTLRSPRSWLNRTNAVGST